MAEGGDWTSKVLCREYGVMDPINPDIASVSRRYFLHGVCKQGSRCHFSHDRGSKPSMVCRYYLQGSCSYGDKCRYDHVKPKFDISPMITNYHTETTPVKPAFKPAPIKVIDTSPIGNMVTLKKSTGEKTPSELPKSPKSPEEWVKATEFVPGQPYVCSAIPPSYSKAVEVNNPNPPPLIIGDGGDPTADPTMLLCPFLAQGHCPYDEDCSYIHGDMCGLCGLAVLHPSDEKQREKHNSDCIKQHEKDMELSFAIAQSQDKVCGICMDNVMEKEPPNERRFGIMSNCNHIFCLSCIRKWRGAKQFENEIVRACPECRVKSDFITPSKFWVETEEEKGKLIQGYKKALSAKPCKYFKRGSGECPFNERCFYQHALPDGTIANPKPKQRRRRQNADGELDILQHINLWDFLEARENRNLLLELEAELDSLIFDIVFASSDSDSDFDDHW